MEGTLGKRIAAHRKNLGLTQDALAEKLGVTAQAVSKWENDQSCPDITMLPKLADIFGCTTDALLGLEAISAPAAVSAAVPEQDETEPNGFHIQNGLWEFQWDVGKLTGLGIAVWLLIAGGLSMASALLNWGVDTWHILWSSGLMIFGLFGMLRQFSAFRLGLFLFGGYFLMWHIGVLPESLTILKWEVVIPGTLILLGLCTLADSLRKPNKGRFRMHHNGKPLGQVSTHCTYDGESFDCSASFGEQHQLITLPRLSGGKAESSFGELVVDLSGCEEIADGCTLELNCAFGELELLIPRHCRVEPNISTSFASFDTKGSPAPDASVRIYVNGSTNFGNITFRYF